MKISVLLFSILLMLTAEASSSTNLVQPTGNNLVATKVDNNNLYAEFKGQIRVTGAVIAKWVNNEEDEPPNTLLIQLVLDESSTNALPHFKDYPVKILSLNDAKNSLLKIIGRNLMAQLENKKILYIKSEGSFVIENYNVGIDCDNAWSRGKLVSFKILKPTKYAGLGIRHVC